MEVKKFEAKTLSEAIENIKRELGPDAIILQTKSNKKGFGLMSTSSVEVTAAVSHESLNKKRNLDRRLPENNRETINSLSAIRQKKIYDEYENKKTTLEQIRKNRVTDKNKNEYLKSLARKTPYAEIDSPSFVDRPIGSSVIRKNPNQHEMNEKIDQFLRESNQNLQMKIPNEKEEKNSDSSSLLKKSLEAEIEELRDLIKKIQSNGKVFDEPAMDYVFDTLLANGVDRMYAMELVKLIQFENKTQDRAISKEKAIDQLALEMLKKIEVEDLISGIKKNKKTVDSGPQIVALVGPTGVGKTTTLAKIASLAYSKKNLKIGVINLDSFKVAARNQIESYANSLNVPFRHVESVSDFKLAVSDLKVCDLILVDTTGRSQKDDHSLLEIEKVLRSINNVRVQLVLSATTRDQELFEMSKKYALFKPECALLTKLDECITFGVLYNFSQKSKLPYCYFTNGQNVPQDIEQASGERVVSLILEF
ncbi:MAG: flagellar biosynthesis protein FlhF [Bdellovibrionaceae bacterium]|nr:flagellar biosynthesis protein FlhF [Pseudobdellovibrionaceae bacterium]|tara:strand:- start:746 stop:2182 length:1437 start_codon:yes stop_codon:yes gene_type:complete